MIHILSIDDSRAIHAYLKDVLSSPKIELDHAYDGAEGVEKVLVKKNRYDLILLDWEMPNMTGPEVMQKFKESHMTIPVIMLTSKNDLQDIQSMVDLGIAEYVMKPFTPQILVEKVETLLGENLDTRSAAT